MLFLQGSAHFQQALAAATQPQSQDDHITGLISDLTSDDNARRQAATQELESIGESARPAVLRAVHSDDPALRSQAVHVLMDMPWFLPTDSPDVQTLLSKYGDPDVTNRRSIVTALGMLPAPDGLVALRRLFVEDPSLDVRWSIMEQLRAREDVAHLAKYRAITPPQDDPAMLALCGYAIMDLDPDKAAQYFQTCADLEFAHPSDDDGQFDEIVEHLSDAACLKKNYDQAASLRRKELARGGPSDITGVPVAIEELFALHANFGPLAGYDDDVKSAGAAMSSSIIQYALSRMYTRAGKKADADTALAAAMAVSTDRRQHYFTGEFLMQHGWSDAAEAEFNEFLKTPEDPNAAFDQKANNADANFCLATLAARKGDEAAEADHLEAGYRAAGEGVTIRTSDGRVTDLPGNEISAEIDWHRMHVAFAKNDSARGQELLQQLIELKPKDADIVIDLVPLLREHGHADDAHALYENSLDDIKTKMSADPTNPEWLNGAAWLNARCGEDLNQAMIWATQASSALPKDAAIMDTLAEVNFDLGHADKAVELETRAIALRPDDTFMAKQLKRFKAGAASQPATPN